MRHLSIPALPFLTLALLLISAQSSPLYAEGREEEYAEWEREDNAKNQALIDANNRAKAQQEREKAIEYAYGGKADQSARRDEDVGDIAGKYGMGEQAEIPQNADTDKFLNSGTPSGYVNNDGRYVCTEPNGLTYKCQEEENLLKHACSGYGSRDEREKCHMRLSFEREDEYYNYMTVMSEAYKPQEHQAGSRADQDSEMNRALNSLGPKATQEEVDNVHKWYDQGGLYEQAEKQKREAVSQAAQAQREQQKANTQAYKAQKQYEAAVASGDQTAIADATAKRDSANQNLASAKQNTIAKQDTSFEEVYKNRLVNSVGPANRSAEYYADANGKDGRNEPVGRREQTQRDYEKAIENELNAAAAQQDARKDLESAQKGLNEAIANEKSVSSSTNSDARDIRAAHERTVKAEEKVQEKIANVSKVSELSYKAQDQVKAKAHEYSATFDPSPNNVDQAEKDVQSAAKDVFEKEIALDEAIAKEESVGMTDARSRDMASRARQKAQEELDEARKELEKSTRDFEKAQKDELDDEKSREKTRSESAFGRGEFDRLDKIDKQNEAKRELDRATRGETAGGAQGGPGTGIGNDGAGNNGGGGMGHGDKADRGT